MGIRQWFHEQFISSPNVVTLLGRCTGNGAATPTSQKFPKDMSIAWVSTGKYTVTLPKKFAGLVSFDASVINTAGTTLSQVFVSTDSTASAGTLTIEVFGGATTVAPTRRDLTSSDILILSISVQDSAAKPQVF